MLFDTGSHGQDIGIEDDVGRGKTDFGGEKVVRSFADGNLVIAGDRLAFLVERHHHHRCAIAMCQGGVLQELGLPFLQADRVHNRLALHALQAGFNHTPVGTVDHHGNASNVWLGR